ncbi:hypothetical protein L7F22_021489 [Adiantum nelumboides]|nr:hypothetical protein [Adiantum nelumboides]
MVIEAPQQQPIMRDFLGLGKLVADSDPAKDEGHGREEPFRSVPSFQYLDSAGAKYPMLNRGPIIEHNFSARKSTDERYMEGSAETFGFSCTKQWPGMVSNNARLEANAKSSTMQLTIFYGGHVNVYNNIPVDRAEAIMRLAAKGDASPPSAPAPPFGLPHTLVAPGFCQPTTAAENLCFNAPVGAPILFAADQASQNGSLNQKLYECAMPNTPSTATSSQPVVPRALPLARKASLARFLERRKERMQMMSPYFKKQIAPAHGDQAVGFIQNAALSELYSQYFTRPTMIYRMQEQTDMSSNGIPAKE